MRLDKATLLERLDDSRLCGWCSKPAILHGFGEFFVFNLLSRRLHSSEECRLGVVLGLALLFLLQFDAVEGGVVSDIPFGEGLDQVRDFVIITLALGCGCCAAICHSGLRAGISLLRRRFFLSF